MERPVTAAAIVDVRDLRATPRPDPGQRPAPPAEPAPVAAGEGRVAIARSDGASGVIACAAASPLQLLLPRPRGTASWIVVASHGGGLVAGDAVSLSVDVGPGAAALLSTQASTKVYRSAGREASQRLRARVAAGGVLAVLPHPTSLFAGARFTQATRLELEAGGSVAWLDAVTAGRTARGERWAADAWRARAELVVGGRLTAVDATRVVRGEGPDPAERLAGVGLLATAIVAGPAFAAGARALLDAIGARPAAAGPDGLLVAASPVADGVLLRLASAETEPGLLFLRDALGFAMHAVDADPFARAP